MKKINFLLIAIVIGCSMAYGQPQATTFQGNLPVIVLRAGHTLHIQSPEPIQYVDIASDRVKGDLPLANLLRLKLDTDSLKSYFPERDLGALTIVGDNFIAQYNLQDQGISTLSNLPVLVEILPEQTRPLEVPGIGLSRGQMKAFAMGILAGSGKVKVRSNTEYGITINLHSVHTVGDYIFLDLSFHNSSRLSYHTDELRFSIDDKKVTKATNVQSVEIEPVWQLYPLTEFRGRHRNVFVFKKMTFPGSKVLNISLTEKQISGRTVQLRIRYGDILEADSF